MGKKKFLNLIKLASQPLPSKAGKSVRSGGYTEKRTRSRKTAGTSSTRSDTSRR